MYFLLCVYMKGFHHPFRKPQKLPTKSLHGVDVHRFSQAAFQEGLERYIGHGRSAWTLYSFWKGICRMEKLWVFTRRTLQVKLNTVIISNWLDMRSLSHRNFEPSGQKVPTQNRCENREHTFDFSLTKTLPQFTNQCQKPKLQDLCDVSCVFLFGTCADTF